MRLWREAQRNGLSQISRCIRIRINASSVSRENFGYLPQRRVCARLAAATRAEEDDEEREAQLWDDRRAFENVLEKCVDAPEGYTLKLSERDTMLLERVGVELPELPEVRTLLACHRGVHGLTRRCWMYLAACRRGESASGTQSRTGPCAGAHEAGERLVNR